MRALGGSGGVPQQGGIALGLADVFRQEPALPVEEWEEERRGARADKDEYEPAPARERKLLLQAHMGKDGYFDAHRSETKALRALRKQREEAVELDRVWNPEFGTLDALIEETTAPQTDSGSAPARSHRLSSDRPRGKEPSRPSPGGGGGDPRQGLPGSDEDGTDVSREDMELWKECASLGRRRKRVMGGKPGGRHGRARPHRVRAKKNK
jgi:hypothetical protein